MIYLARWFKILVYGVLLMGTVVGQDFFKFSTIYGAYSFSSPITKQQQFEISTTKQNPNIANNSTSNNLNTYIRENVKSLHL